MLVFILTVFFTLFFSDLLSNKQAKDVVNSKSFHGLEEQLNIFNENKGFYNNFRYYINLLDEEQFDYLNDAIADSEKGMERIRQINWFVNLYDLFRDEQVAEIIYSLEDDIEKNKSNSSEYENGQYSCEKYVEERKIKTTKPIKFVYYDMTLEKCAYVSYGEEVVDDIPGNTMNFLYISNLVDNTEIDKFGVKNDALVRYGDYEQIERIEKRRFIKYILQSTDYNVDLFGEVDFIL